jgi:hypothetical protein
MTAYAGDRQKRNAEERRCIRATLAMASGQLHDRGILRWVPCLPLLRLAEIRWHLKPRSRGVIYYSSILNHNNSQTVLN